MHRRLHAIVHSWDTSRFYEVGDVLFLETKGQSTDQDESKNATWERVTNIAPVPGARGLGRVARVPTPEDPTLLIELHLT